MPHQDTALSRNSSGWPLSLTVLHFLWVLGTLGLITEETQRAITWTHALRVEDEVLPNHSRNGNDTLPQLP